VPMRTPARPTIPVINSAEAMTAIMPEPRASRSHQPDNRRACLWQIRTGPSDSQELRARDMSFPGDLRHSDGMHLAGQSESMAALGR